MCREQECMHAPVRARAGVSTRGCDCASEHEQAGRRGTPQEAAVAEPGHVRLVQGAGLQARPLAGVWVCVSHACLSGQRHALRDGSGEGASEGKVCPWHSGHTAHLDAGAGP